MNAFLPLLAAVTLVAVLAVGCSETSTPPQATTTTMPMTTTPSNHTAHSSDPLSVAAIAGIAVGGAAIVIAVYAPDYVFTAFVMGAYFIHLYTPISSVSTLCPMPLTGGL